MCGQRLGENPRSAGGDSVAIGTFCIKTELMPQRELAEVLLSSPKSGTSRSLAPQVSAHLCGAARAFPGIPGGAFPPIVLPVWPSCFASSPNGEFPNCHI